MALTGAVLVLSGVSPSGAADVGPTKARICISVFRYGGAASGWQAVGGNAIFPHSDTLSGILEHITQANQVFDAVNTVVQNEILPPGVNVGDTFRANAEWVWLDKTFGFLGAVEDLPDPFGNGKGDIEGGPADDSSHRIMKPSEGGSTGSRDIDFILKEITNAQCYPVVFVNSPDSRFTGLTVVEPSANVLIGVVTLINSNAFPRIRVAEPPTFRNVRMISTLAHELSHAACLDPAVAGWGDASGHPPHPQGISGNPAMPPDTPEGRGVVVPPGFADTGKQWRSITTWFTGDERSGEERFTLRQANLANACVAGQTGLRDRTAPSFSVAAGSVFGLPDNKILWAPQVPANAVPPPITLGLAPGELDAFSYDWNKFPQGRFRFKFSVDSMSRGLPGTDVRRQAGMVVPEQPALVGADEFAAPLGPNAKSNVRVLAASQFGLQPSDAINGLAQISPGKRDPNINGMRAIDFDRDGILDRGARVYFSVGRNFARDPADVFVAVGDGITDTPPTAVYASRADLGLLPGDNIDALCVRDNGNGVFDGPPVDEVLFSLTRDSPSVRNGTFSSSDVLLGHGGGVAPLVIAPAESLGLRGGADDELNALKCYTPPLFCDVNRDGKVDRNDIQLIFNARGQQATAPGDPRDADGDGVITVNDARICVLQCTNPNCAP